MLVKVKVERNFSCPHFAIQDFKNKSIVQQIFSDIYFKIVTLKELKGRAILTVTNDLSIQINNLVLEWMPGNEVIYESMDNIVSNDPKDQLAYTEESLNSLTPTGVGERKRAGGEAS
ncbi:hypothetical protein AVEN_97658-1 [Araneus ventricosus]|uniref:Uncharacterized protein n=1 Tax=Araneus ventricosus TaxID=182803 RepID=A0A4Y2GWP6_ARAVE|nr:hypothetical protein AVEN_97658-1 [Araneus ventricosus]